MYDNILIRFIIPWLVLRLLVAVSFKVAVKELEFDSDTFEVTCAVHLATYLNKLLLGSRQGRLQLWNIRTK